MKIPNDYARGNRDKDTRRPASFMTEDGRIIIIKKAHYAGREEYQ